MKKTIEIIHYFSSSFPSFELDWKDGEDLLEQRVRHGYHYTKIARPYFFIEDDCPFYEILVYRRDDITTWK